jgi:membrane protease YdiL (CAAX protease family)
MASRRRQTAPPRPDLRPGLARPLESLVFLAPLILFYEIASLVAAPASPHGRERVVAFHLLQIFFELFGSTGALMPAFAVVAILLATHVLSRQPWTVRRRPVGMMYVESVALALPLVLFNRWVPLAGGGIFGEAALCIGAGIYEELVFRLILISAIMIVGVDLFGRSATPTLIAALIVSALLFAAHHHPPVGSDPYHAGRFIFRTLAGVYLGVIFVVRGYGLAAGTHAAYNLIVVGLAAILS